MAGGRGAPPGRARAASIAHHVETQAAETLPELVPTIVGVARALMFTPIEV